MKRRKFIKTTGSLGLIFAPISGCVGKSQRNLSGRKVPKNIITKIGAPKGGDSARPILGKKDAKVTIKYFGNWKCPFCSDLSTGYLKEFTEKYIKEGDVNLEFYSLSFINGDVFLGKDAVIAGNAGLSVWKNDRNSYWTYHEYIFKHQPSEQLKWASSSNLKSAMKTIGVNNIDTIINEVRNKKYNGELMEISETASNLGITGTPNFAIDGEVFNPLGQEKQIENKIETLLEEN